MTLEADLSVTVEDGTASFVYWITNQTSSPVTLSFRSGKRYELEVNPDAAEDPIWSSSDDRAYPMVMGTETLDPGEQLIYEEQLDGLPDGRFTARAYLVSTEIDAETTVSFTVG